MAIMDSNHDDLAISETLPSIDMEVQRVRDQINVLATRRHALTSVLLSSQRIRSLIGPSSSTSGTQTDPSSLAALISRQSRRSSLAIRRAALSTTFFATQDPDPRAPSGVRTLRGIRIERFSHITRTFLTPAYVFLQRAPVILGSQDNEDTGDDEIVLEDDIAKDYGKEKVDEKVWWRVHRHTIPPTIPLQALVERHLPLPTTVTPNEDADGDALEVAGLVKSPIHKQDLKAFVCALRSEVVSLLRREEAIQQLSAAGTSRGGTEAIRIAEAVNGEATDMRVKWVDGGVGRFRLRKNGGIERAVIKGRDGARDATRERMTIAKGTVKGLASAL